MKTLILSRDEIEAAAEIIADGGVVAAPTETVYGLCADGLDERAIRRIFEAKGRPEDKPISLFVTDMEAAEELCEDIPEEAYALADRFWPGPLTMIFRKSEAVPELLTAGGDTVGVRCPDNEITIRLLESCGVPLTGTSANLSGEPNASTADEVLDYFAGKIGAVLLGDRAGGGVPSTVLDMTGETPKILREGGITAYELEAVIGRPVER